MATYQLSGLCKKTDGTVDPNTPIVTPQCECVAVDNTTGEVTINNEGDIITLLTGSANTPSLVDNGDGTYTFDDGTGNLTTFDINEIDMDVNEITITGSVITFTSEDGTTVNADICAIVAANCNATYVINADGSATFTDNAGTETTIPAPTVSTVEVNTNGTFTHTSGDDTEVIVSLCDLMAGLTDDDEDIDPLDVIPVVQPDGTCKLKSLPDETEPTSIPVTEADPFNPTFDCADYEPGDVLTQGGTAPNFDFVWGIFSDGAGGCTVVCLKSPTAGSASPSK